MEYLVGLIAILAGLFVYEKGKRKAAESLNTNIEVKEKVQNEQAKIDKVDAQLELEETNRSKLREKLNKNLNEKLNETLAKFFNDKLNDK